MGGGVEIGRWGGGVEMGRCGGRGRDEVWGEWQRWGGVGEGVEMGRRCGGRGRDGRCGGRGRDLLMGISLDWKEKKKKKKKNSHKRCPTLNDSWPHAALSCIFTCYKCELKPLNQSSMAKPLCPVSDH